MALLSPSLSLSLILVIELLQQYAIVVAFAPPSSTATTRFIISSSSNNNSKLLNYQKQQFSISSSSSRIIIHPLYAKQYDDDNKINDNDDDDKEEEDGLDSLIGKKLGINIGAQLPALSQSEIDDIKAAAQLTLDAAVDSRLADIETLRSELQDELRDSRKRIDIASQLNVQYEKQNLLDKIDTMTNEFLYKDKDFRDGTKLIADVDANMGKSGRGVDWGSWGTTVGDGREVVVTAAGSGGRGEGGGGSKKLLGSVDSARRRAEIASLDDDDDDEEELTIPVDVENRVLVVVDDKKDKESVPILGKLTALLNEAFDSDINIDTYSPLSGGNIPIGGNNAQTAIIFASSLNDRSSLERLLGRILKRTAPVSGGAAGMPPSHVVLVSALGTERTNKMPYSMTNLFGGKLDKMREIEQAIVTISRSRKGNQTPLDYTIVKFGDVADGEAEVTIKPGDVLDGSISSDAAANVLLQAMAYQPYARNSTLCATGSLSSANVPIDVATWNDKFLALSGPELLRIDAGRGAEETDEGILDSKYEQLRQYIKQWSATYEGDRKGTGLTTPVLVRKSRKPTSAFDGVIARDGVRILFQTTNTGDRYKSASEEKTDDKDRNRGGGGSTTPKKSSSAPVMTKARKEGGVEVLVEKTTDGNIRIRARRCNIDNKTIVKEMSENVIVKSLKKAVEAWVKARDTTGF